MIEWLIWGVLIIFALIVLQLEHHSRRVKFFIMLIIGVLLYFSLVGLFSSDQVDLTSPKGIVNGGYVYVGWLGDTFASLWGVGKDTVKTVGNIVKLNQTETSDGRR